MREEKRRSPRIAARIPLDAQWVSDDRVVQQTVITETISAHGALLRLLTSKPPSETIQLDNLATRQRRAARIVAASEVPGISSLFELRVEFEAPSLEFWGREDLTALSALPVLSPTD